MAAARALILVLALGCSSAPARPSRVAVVEILHGRHESAVYRVSKAAHVKELLAWVDKYYRKPPPQDEIGSVFPEAAIVFSEVGDFRFERPPELRYVIYGDLDAGGNHRLIPVEDLNLLEELVVRAGVPYEGTVRTGVYALKLWEGEQSGGFDMGLQSSCDAPFDRTRKAALDTLAELGYAVREQSAHARFDLRILASKGQPERFVRIGLSKAEESTRISVLVRTRGGGQVAEDDEVGREVHERIRKRAESP